MQFFDLSSLNGEAWLAWIIYWMLAAFFVHRTVASEGFLGRLKHLIPLYAGCFLLFHGRHPPLLGRLYDSSGMEAIGDLLTFGGLLFTVWARVHLGRYWSGLVTIKAGHRLIRSGPYQFVRHPIYTGLLIAVTGSSIQVSTGEAFVGVLLVLAAFIIKSRREEKVLTAELGEEYDRYKQEVPALIPYRALVLLKTALDQDRGGEVLESPAFAAATLRSEQFRIAGTVLIIGFLCLLSIARSLIDPQHNDHASLGVYLALLLAAVLFEAAMYAVTRRARRAAQGVQAWVWALTTIIECSFPTLVILGLTADTPFVGPYRALLSSPVLIYFLFIILSTIRLNPWLCILSGLTSAAGYMGVYLFTLHIAPRDRHRDIVMSSTYSLYGAYLLFSGLLAAGVTRRIRRHVVAALAEAETRRKLDRVEYDLRTARSIQMGLLPKSAPSVAGYDIAGWSQPADQTGGDFYDWIELPRGPVLFIIADAAGHGIGPALLIAACRGYFRAIAQRGEPLDCIMAQVDRLITPDTPDGRFITAAVALLEPQESRLTLYSAGHGPLYFFKAATNEIQMLDADEPPLGVGLVGQTKSPARVMNLSPGDSLVMVTDGFFEWANPSGDLLGIERVGESIRRHHAAAADDLIRQAHAEVLAFSRGTPQADDLTAVVIKRNGTNAAP